MNGTSERRGAVNLLRRDLQQAAAAPMPAVLFLSDLHLGRGSAAEQAAAERDLLALLGAHERAVVDEGGALFLVGDVFEQYLEYRHLVPKGFVRFQALLAGWADRGAAVTYLVGNRDPWHVDHFERGLGVRVVRDALEGEVGGLRTYIAHGDALLPRTPLASRFRSLVRSPFMARLYRMSLPGDAGYALARWVSLRFGSPGVVSAPDADHLEVFARSRLGGTGTDLVVLGHVHRPACIPTPGGTYLNPGYWFADRTFGRLDLAPEAGPQAGPRIGLYRWTDSGAEALNPTAPSRVEAPAPSP